MFHVIYAVRLKVVFNFKLLFYFDFFYKYSIKSRQCYFAVEYIKEVFVAFFYHIHGVVVNNFNFL